MELAGAYKPEKQKRILYSNLHGKQLDSTSQMKRVRGANTKMLSAPKVANVKDKGIGATVDALVMGIVNK